MTIDLADLDADMLQQLAERRARGRAALGLGADGRPLPAAAGARATVTAPPPAMAALVPGRPRGDDDDPPFAPLPPGEDPSPVPTWKLQGKRLVFGGGDRFECRGGCGKRFEYPGLCQDCAAEKARIARREAMGLRRVELRKDMPKLHHDATWEALPGLHRRRSTEPRVHATTDQLRAIREALEGSLQSILIGPSGAGKSTLAACHAHAALERGQARFIQAFMLEDEGHPLFREAELADDLVLDDLCSEFFGAPAGGGIAALRMRPVLKLVRLRVSACRRTVMTLGRTEAQLIPFYGPDHVRRIFEGSTEIPIGEFPIAA